MNMHSVEIGMLYYGNKREFAQQRDSEGSAV